MVGRGGGGRTSSGPLELEIPLSFVKATCCAFYISRAIKNSCLTYCCIISSGYLTNSEESISSGDTSTVRRPTALDQSCFFRFSRDTQLMKKLLFKGTKLVERVIYRLAGDTQCPPLLCQSYFRIEYKSCLANCCPFSSKILHLQPKVQPFWTFGSELHVAHRPTIHGRVYSEWLCAFYIQKGIRTCLKIFHTTIIYGELYTRIRLHCILFGV